MEAKHTPDFVVVTKSDFYAVVGPMNVNPRVRAESLRFRNHVSTWETPYRDVVGRSWSDSWGIEPTRYELTPRFAARAAEARAAAARAAPSPTPQDERA